MIPRGATISLTGRPFLGRCVDCGRLILANSMWWGSDLGSQPGSKTYPVRCTDCAKRNRAVTSTERKP